MNYSVVCTYIRTKLLIFVWSEKYSMKYVISNFSLHHPVKYEIYLYNTKYIYIFRIKKKQTLTILS